MPATRPSTRIQRRAQPVPSRPATLRRRTAPPRGRKQHANIPAEHHAVADPPAATVEASPASTAAPLSDVAVQQIVSAVSQAVLVSLNAANSPQPPPSSHAETRELPIVESGIVSGTADATSQGPVASALHHISGENFVQVSPLVSSGISNFNSVTVPIDAQVSAKLKAKIWANEYFDFGLLLHSRAGDTRYHLSLCAESGSGLPTLSLEPTTKSKPIANVDMWTSAFQIFVGVYTGKYPMEAPLLMKYGEVVRDLAARGGDWRFYDSQFRLLRQSNPSAMPWGNTHWELWIRAQHFGTSRQSKQHNGNMRNAIPSSTSGIFVPRGFCRKFHRGFDCQGCNFKHQCFKCGVIHPAVRCNFRPSRQPSDPTTSAAKSRPANTSSH